MSPGHAHVKMPNDDLPVDGPSRLSADINRATRDVHNVLNHLIMTRLPLGLLQPTLYREGVLSIFYIFRTFESAWQSHLSNPDLDPRLRQILTRTYIPAMQRTRAILADVAYYYSLPLDLAEKTYLPLSHQPSLPTRQSIVNHIEKVTREKPHVLLSYGHVMYMALFAGGRILKLRILDNDIFFPGTPKDKETRQRMGVNMFSFEGRRTKEEEEEIRIAWKAGMGDAENLLTKEEWNDCCEEGAQVFRLMESMIYELDTIKAPVAYAVIAKYAVGALLAILMAYALIFKYLPILIAQF
ncbi:heme oxygenase-like protein [Ascobolus immersus RN42]|uniref:Heme oxygenase-like protein n=1 Tax=Ascobolus immersus RN42 TaxID=1160509 RepID=A0A3N4IGB2_ASCIM|nr:heme oxygenase-like protein [Ascobolus immersus RN42]